MSDTASTDIENAKISLSTAVKWGAVLVTLTLAVGGALVKIDSLQSRDDKLEDRVHNLEENVLWRHEQ